MSVTGRLAHIDISIGYPERSIVFYETFLVALGYRRCEVEGPEWCGPHPSRATWALESAAGLRFEIEVRGARLESRDRKYDRYEPGPHHLAFHAASRAVVDAVHDAMVAMGACILDPPADYGGRSGYVRDYYAFFVADPDGVKLEVVHIPSANP